MCVLCVCVCVCIVCVCVCVCMSIVCVCVLLWFVAVSLYSEAWCQVFSYCPVSDLCTKIGRVCSHFFSLCQQLSLPHVVISTAYPLSPCLRFFRSDQWAKLHHLQLDVDWSHQIEPRFSAAAAHPRQPNPQQQLSPRQQQVIELVPNPVFEQLQRDIPRLALLAPQLHTLTIQQRNTQTTPTCHCLRFFVCCWFDLFVFCVCVCVCV